MRILFVCSGDFRGPSEKQVLRFAEVLTGQGHHVAVSIGGDLASVQEEGADAVERLEVWRHEFRGPRLSRRAARACAAFAPTLVHAFNSRVPVVAAARSYSELSGAPVAVHFEDDEWGLARARAGEPAHRRLARGALRRASVAQPSLWQFASPRSLGWVRERAVALDALTPALAAHVGERLGRDCAVLLPPVAGVSATLRPKDGNPPPGEAVIAYTGAVFGSHLADFELGLRAVARLRADGRPVRFVHMGRMAPRFSGSRLAEAAGLPPGAATFLGYRPAAEVEQVMAEAAVLIQPGAPTEFNRLRLPSKLPAYLASGTPTVTFAVGAGELFEDRVEVVKTHTGDADELAERIAEVLDQPELRATLSRGGPTAAARLFDPERCTEALLNHYAVCGGIFRR